MKIHFTPHQVKKLLKHQPVHIPHHQMGKGLALHHEMPEHHVKGLKHAHKHKTGYTLHFHPHELKKGTGFWDWIKSNVWEKGLKPIAQPFVELVKPALKIAKPLVKQYSEPIAKAASAYTGLPISSEMVKGAADVSGHIGGFGLHHHRPHHHGHYGAHQHEQSKYIHGSHRLASNFAHTIGVHHPVMSYQPQFSGHDMRALLPPHTAGGALLQFDNHQFQNMYVPTQYGGGHHRHHHTTHGGSFKPSGY